ncbi:MAG: cysteine--tRNA ligase [Chlamydiae bacterium]|nr:cysteine--tRNA ligase [Chlamydiota bacterium]
MLKIFDTKSRKVVDLIPQDGKTVRMYTCGPTVYNFPHIGNLRTYVFEDLLRRAIKFFGMNVYQVMNLTDIDDKTIKGALAKKVSLNEFTEIYKKAFFEDLKTLEVEKAEIYPAATDHIDDMIKMIQILIDKGVAYKTEDGNVFFRIAKFPGYGALSHLNLSELKVGASERVRSDEYEKESVSDFALWKAYEKEKDGDIFWESPFGKGRPGWHIECSAMAIKYLGVTLDLHMGGVDNMFPHHENEIAQSEGCTGKTFSKYWMHTEHLLVDGKKMSKSLGNFYTLRDLLAKGYKGREVRYLLLSTHYRTQLNFTFEGLEAARSSLRRFDDFILRLKKIEAGIKDEAEHEIEIAKKGFREALSEDLNISNALAALFDFIRKIHTFIDNQKLGKESAEKILHFFKECDSVLAIFSDEEESAPKEIQEKAERRLIARQEKDWKLADLLRNEIDKAGYLVEDLPQGFVIKKK